MRGTAAHTNLLRMSIRTLPRVLRDRVRLLMHTQRRSHPQGTLRRFFAASHATPHGTKANCYAHFLGLRPGRRPDGSMQRGGLTNRPSKAQPGEKCNARSASEPLSFHDRGVASKQIIRRVKCDNPLHVFHLPGPYTTRHLDMPLPRGYHMGCAIVGGSDYHFLRRESIRVVLRDKIFREVMPSKTRLALARALKNGHNFVWSHVSGWSGGMRVVDADGEIILNPVPRTARNAKVRLVPNAMRANHHYPGLHYDHFVGLFVVRSRAASVRIDNGSPVDTLAMRQRLIARGARPHTANAVVANVKV
jgi:hypothetical protein